MGKNEFGYKLTGDIILISKSKNISYAIEGFKNAEKRSIFYRTCGLNKICKHELEINLSLHPTEAQRILNCIVEKILEGVIIDNFLVTSELTNAPVYIKEYKSIYPKYEGEICYRIIFSDENFLLPMEELCDPIYKKQLEG